jgi:putative restriction endonuclease
MRYWWVNQNQTYRHEVLGGYLWSPKLKKDGRANPFYEFMREVAPGDIIFSFCDTAIKAIGVATLHAYEAPKPAEFGKVGMNWELIGWRVDVRFTELRGPIRPIDHIERLRPYLPSKYSPLTLQGRGQQSVYLTAVSELLAYQLIDLIGSEARTIVHAWTASEPLAASALTGQILWEEHQIEELKADTAIAETEREAIVLARRGQGLFRSRVAQIERRCRLTGVSNTDHLRASHTKPWRDANNQERVDGENGFLLTPDADHLFDRGFISFDSNGDVLVSPVVDLSSLSKMGLTSDLLKNVGPFSEGQRSYLQFHRESIFLRSRFNGR